METITIEVDKEVAKAYRESDLNKQEKVNTIIILLFQPEYATKSLSEVMADIAYQAEERGLTPAILEDILNDEE